MTSVSSSRLPTGSRTDRSTTSLVASRFRERCDPFLSCGRSTNKSSVVVSVTARFGRRIWTGLTTPVTPTLFNRNPFATRSLWTSFGIDSTRPGLPSRTLKTCRRQCAELHRGAPRRTGGGGRAEGSTCSSFAQQSFRSKWQRKRSRGPLPALRRGSPEALAGGRWLGGGLLSVSAEADEAVVVEGDRPHLPGRLDRLRRLHLDVDCVVVLLLDLLRPRTAGSQRRSSRPRSRARPARRRARLRFPQRRQVPRRRRRCPKRASLAGPLPGPPRTRGPRRSGLLPRAVRAGSSHRIRPSRARRGPCSPRLSRRP